MSRATFYHRQEPVKKRQQPRPTPPRALSADEQNDVLALLDSSRFVDRAPAEVKFQQYSEDLFFAANRRGSPALIGVATSDTLSHAESTCVWARRRRRRHAQTRAGVGAP